jgi:hypothetical protein
MNCAKRPRLPKRPPATGSWLPILAMSLLVSMPALAQGSRVPEPGESPPVSPQPELLYTEAEALEAARAAARAALDAAVPLAVQAAVAEERGKAAAQRVLDRAEAEAYQRQARSWRAAALVAAGMGAGGLAAGGRGALYGATGAAMTAAVWWICEQWWPWQMGARLSP